MSASVKRFLANELRKDESDLIKDRSWTRHSLLRAGLCPFGRKGTNNLVEQLNSTQVDQRHYDPYRFFHAWVENVREKENEILQAAEKLRGKILTPYAESVFSFHSNGVRRCRIRNWNVAPRINSDADVEVIETHPTATRRGSVSI